MKLNHPAKIPIYKINYYFVPRTDWVMWFTCYLTLDVCLLCAPMLASLGDSIIVNISRDRLVCIYYALYQNNACCMIFSIRQQSKLYSFTAAHKYRLHYTHISMQEKKSINSRVNLSLNSEYASHRVPTLCRKFFLNRK